MEKTILIVCANCKKEYKKSLKEYKRQIKKGNNRFFCNSSCAAIKISTEIKRKGNPQYLVPDNRRDKFSSFRWFVNRAKYRSKSLQRYDSNISVEYLKDIWDLQNGICPFTGWELILPNNSSYPWKDKNPANASLDRIDNSKGYIEGNVRFIAFMANIARQSFTDEQLIAFCKAVANKKQ